MEEFLKSVERRAFRMAELATHSSDDAMDILQDTMIALVNKYSDKPSEEWKPLFFRILQNRIKDWHRRSKVRNVWRSFWDDTDEDVDPISQYADPAIMDQGDVMGSSQALEKVHSAIRTLPWRQRQTFLLRAWEDMSVSETAQVMSISEGSVKTHFSRATHTLRKLLGDNWDE
jgi:RNA polymerase sigma-70 factor (ECF subfamily)